PPLTYPAATQLRAYTLSLDSHDPWAILISNVFYKRVARTSEAPTPLTLITCKAV
ncbi:hypothetical protein COCCADRAFT_113432, partial [Bipolaris zeicola 26-R-13]